jgi:hypothetical protein
MSLRRRATEGYPTAGVLLITMSLMAMTPKIVADLAFLEIAIHIDSH